MRGSISIVYAVPSACFMPFVAPTEWTLTESSREVRLRLADGRAGPRSTRHLRPPRLDHTDFDDTYWAVKRLVKRLGRDRDVRAEDVAIPVETRAGEVAQVDFGICQRV